jgi:transcriptional regulator of acetoin/glycerol metabolism
MHSWPGNVRSLRGLAETLATKAGALDRPGDTRKAIAEFFEEEARRPSSGSQAPEQEGALSPRRDRLLSALIQTQWNRPRAASFLKIDPATLWRWLRAEPDLRKVADLDREDLLRKLQAAQGDLEVVAQKLGIPAELLARRLGR